MFPLRPRAPVAPSGTALASNILNQPFGRFINPTKPSRALRGSGSQYLPLKKDQSLLAEIGPAGYGSFQVSDDAGRNARDPGVHDKVCAAGIRVGITVPKRMMVLNFHWFHEFSAVDRFKGTALGLSFVARLGSPR
jgi:hypothetical protein